MTNYQWQKAPTNQWQQTQAKLNAHFLQQSAWGKFQHIQGKQVFYANGSNWSWLAILEPARFGSRLYCPYGPTAKNTAALKIALEALISCAKQNNAMHVRIEPQGPFNDSTLLKMGLRAAHRTIQPRYTFIKDLTKSEDALMSEMTSTNRNLWRTASNKGITFKHSTNPNDINVFLQMMHEVAARNDITIHKDNYYKTMAQTLMPLGAMQIFIADVQGKPAASSLVFEDSTTRYYAHAASHAQYRKLTPGTPLVSYMIFDAKNAGKKTFDFYGIAPPNQPNHRWAGFTKFKKSFGGQEIDQHGTWEIGVKKVPYEAYRLLARLVR